MKLLPVTSIAPEIENGGTVVDVMVTVPVAPVSV